MYGYGYTLTGAANPTSDPSATIGRTTGPTIPFTQTQASRPAATSAGVAVSTSAIKTGCGSHEQDLWLLILVLGTNFSLVAIILL